MKKIFQAIVLFPMFALGQSTDQNYIVNTIAQDTIPNGKPPIVNVAYFNGLGSPMQKVAYKQGGNGNDIITHFEYDDFGRQAQEFLPYVAEGQSLNYRNIDSSVVLQYYSTPHYQGMETTAVPFSEKQLEESPLNRVFKQSAPGESWAIGSGHEVKFEYQTNEQNDDRVLILKVTTSVASGFEAFQPYLVQDGSYYSSGTLYKTITKDENWSSAQTLGKLNTTAEYKNKEGQVILKRTYNLVENEEKAHDTYYVYDDYGNLTYVIPPLASACNCDFTTILDDLCYQYKYDYRNRLVEKKLPGKQWEFIVYNNQDKPVATGPALNPWGDGKWGWMITKYDAFDRIVYTGWKADTVSSESRNSLQESLGVLWYEHAVTSNTIDSIVVSYSNDTTPTDIKLLTVNYYDSYVHSNAPSLIPTTVEGVNVATNLKGLATGSWVRILTKDSDSRADVTHLFYDYKWRVLKSDKKSYTGGYTISENKLDFTGKILKSTVNHKSDASPYSDAIKTTDYYTYSDQGRLLTHNQQINSLPIQLISKNDYNELGQLMTKQVGGTDVTNFVGLQKVDYQYNIRGWLKSINNVDELQEVQSSASIPKDLFAFQIKYNDPESNANNQVSGLFNGNISETTWRSSADNVKRSYGYMYDNLNRLRKAIYQKPGSAVPVTDMYNEEMDYDLNGNIQWLRRNGDLDDPYATFAIQIDDLSYNYDPQKRNQLIEVTDASTHPKGFKDDIDSSNAADYKYDDNGNLLSDLNKNIQIISYNHLNLPVTIKFDDTHKIEYLYDAAGMKVQKKVTNGALVTSTGYLDGFQYTNGLLSFFPHAEGYVNVTRCQSCDDKYHNLYDYVFNYTDHLGNVRMSWALDKAPNLLKIVEENNYYPFGLKHTHYNVDHKHFELLTPEEGGPIPGGIPMTKMAQLIGGNYSTTSSATYNYKYNGKEYQDELGLNMYDYGARFYDPALGRFWQVDPVAETSRRFSTYSYALNNPVYFIDRDGMFADTLESQNSGESEQGTPFGNPFDKSPKQTSPLGGTMQNFTPSDKTTSLLAEGKELLSNVFGYEASTSAGYSLGASGTVGPVKVEGEVSVAEVSVKTNDKNLVEAKAEGVGAKASASVGDAKLGGSVSSGSVKVEVDKKLNVKTSSEGAKASGTATMGKDTKLSLSNSGTLALSVKIPTPEGVSAKAGVSVNLYNAGKGVVKMIQGGVSYLKDYVSNWFSGN